MLSRHKVVSVSWLLDQVPISPESTWGNQKKIKSVLALSGLLAGCSREHPLSVSGPSGAPLHDHSREGPRTLVPEVTLSGEL